MDIIVKKLDVKRDIRGTLFEILRSADVGNAPFGQILVTTARPGETKGGHYHVRKREWYCVLAGKGVLILDDPKNGEHKEIILESTVPMVVEMPKGVFHKIKNIAKKNLVVLVYVSEPFDGNDADTFSK